MAISKLTNNVKPLDEVDKINEIIDGKQDALVSGTNIKTINSNSILGSGNLQLDSLPSQTGNAGKFLQTDGTDASWESAPFRNVGEIVASTIPLTDAGLHLLDGALIQGNGIYSAFVDYIAGLYTSGDYTAIFDTEANWQTAVTTYGVCGKFVYDSVNNTVRLPKYSNKIYTQDIDATAPVVGNGTSLGVTDGTKNAGIGASPGGYVLPTTSTFGSGVGTTYTASYITSGKSLGVTTDPTKSGIIADLANITTSLDGYYYIVVATSTKTDIEVDIDEIATDLNGKADVDLTNCTKPHIVETYVNGTSWYRIYSDGWCEQGGLSEGAAGNKQIVFLVPFANTNYTIKTSTRYSTGTNIYATAIINTSLTTTGYTQYNPYAFGSYWEVRGYIS